jgi:hypothetical protein
VEWGPEHRERIRIITENAVDGFLTFIAHPEPIRKNTTLSQEELEEIE